MERERFEIELLEYVEGRLDPARAAAVRGAMEHDPQLRARVEGMQRDRELLMEEAREVAAPEGSVERAISRAEREALVEATSMPRRKSGGAISKVGALAAVLGLAALASWWAWDFANESAQHEPLVLESPFGEDMDRSPLDGWEDPDDVPISAAIESTIESVAEAAGNSGSLSDLEMSEEMERAIEEAKIAEAGRVSLDDLAIFDMRAEFVGPEFVPAIDKVQLDRAVVLSQADRLVLRAKVAWPYEATTVQSVALAEQSWSAAYLRNWGEGEGGHDLADEDPVFGLSGIGGAPVEGEEGEGAGGVALADGVERVIVWADDDSSETLESTIGAIAEEVRRLDGVVEVLDIESQEGARLWDDRLEGAAPVFFEGGLAHGIWVVFEVDRGVDPDGER